MLKFRHSPGSCNDLRLNISKDENKDNLFSFLQILIDLHLNIPVKLSVDFELANYPMKLSKLSRGGYSKVKVGGFTYEYIVCEVDFIDRYADAHDFTLLREHIQSFLPKEYSAFLGLALLDKALMSLFKENSVLIFTFKDDLLHCISTGRKPNADPNISTNEYYITTDIKKLILNEDKESLNTLFNSSFTQTLLNNPQSRYSFYQHSSYTLDIFIMSNYMRINSYEIDNNIFSLLVATNFLLGPYSNNPRATHLFDLLLNPEIILDKTINVLWQVSTGSVLLQVKNAYTGIPLPGSFESYYPTVLFASIDSDHLMRLTLSDDDKDFLTEVRALDKKDIYTKHKTFLYHEDDKVVRGCKALTNTSKTIRVLVKENKKKLSDTEAFKNRIFRDYLGYGISVMAIPLFQREFNIPSYSTTDFKFKMADIAESYYYSAGYSKTLRVCTRYNEILTNPKGGLKPIIPTKLSVPDVSMFVHYLNNQEELTTSTQARPSIFTRQFVKPYIEKSINYCPPETVSHVFGWMYGMDNPEALSWLSSISQMPLLLRASTLNGRYVANAGLLTDKTFGIKSILQRVFISSRTNPESLSKLLVDSSIGGADYAIDNKDQVRFLSHVSDIYSANFVPTDVVEQALKTFGVNTHWNMLAHINQLLFLSGESLTILHALYKCSNYIELIECLDIHMPRCLEVLDSLDEYSVELKQHVSLMLNYYRDTTKAISEEITENDTESITEQPDTNPAF